MNPGREANEYSPCSLKLLTPYLSSFGKERENAVATFAVQGFRPPTSWRRGRRGRGCSDAGAEFFKYEA
jgi:hypothetical protein